MKKGRLIVIEGIDGSGKSTQAELTVKRLAARGERVRLISFPTYKKSSALIEMYLAGEFGSAAGDVNAYAASAFYAVDRYASYKSDWGGEYDSGGLIIAARYTTSNAIHQGVKLSGPSREEYLSWLQDFEYNKMGLPRPDLVIFLDMPQALAWGLISGRYEKSGGKRDLHESDKKYFETLSQSAREISDYLGWSRIVCAEGEKLLSIEQINKKINDKIESCRGANFF